MNTWFDIPCPERIVDIFTDESGVYLVGQSGKLYRWHESQLEEMKT